MNRVLDLPALHMFFFERAVNGKVTVEAHKLAGDLGVSSGTMYTALRELQSEGRLTLAYKTSARHPVFDVADPAQWGQVPTGRPASPKIGEATTAVRPKGRKPAWG
jgi:hypothetical protein